MIKAWRRGSAGSRLFDALNAAFMILLTVIFLYPVVNVIAISFSSAKPVIQGIVTFYPRGFTASSYTYVMKDPYLFRGYLNTILYAAGFTFLNLSLTSLIAYALTKPDYVLHKFTTVYLTVTMFFSGGLIPTYILISRMGLINTFWVMILPGTVSAYNCFVYRTFFKTIPAELSESAYLDGASDMRILWQIIIPLSKPLLAAFGLFSIVGVWNSWFNAMLYLNDQQRYPLQLLLRNYLFIIDNNQLQQRAGVPGIDNPLFLRQIEPLSIRMAMVVITMFPIMATYPYFQRFFMKGVMIGAVKG